MTGEHIRLLNTEVYFPIKQPARPVTSSKRQRSSILKARSKCSRFLLYYTHFIYYIQRHHHANTDLRSISWASSWAESPWQNLQAQPAHCYRESQKRTWTVEWFLQWAAGARPKRLAAGRQTTNTRHFENSRLKSQTHIKRICSPQSVLKVYIFPPFITLS